MELKGDPMFFLEKKVSQRDSGNHSSDDLGEALKGSFKKALQVKSPFARLMVYNHGRIAWWPAAFTAPYIAVVDDLRTAERRIFQFPKHRNIQKGYKTAMSDQLLLLGREKMLHAWHLDKDLLAFVEVPELFERCIAEGSVVLIITLSSEVYKWEFGGALEKTSLSSLGCYQPGLIQTGVVESPSQAHDTPFHLSRRPGLVLKGTGMRLDLILHPYLKDVVFVVTMHQGRLVVHETDHGRLVQTHHMLNGSVESAEPWTQINEGLRWENCDSYGGYRLLSIYLSRFHQPDLPADWCRSGDRVCTGGPEYSPSLVSVCFNIYTRRFKLYCHHFQADYALYPNYDRGPAAFHLWDAKLYTSYYAAKNMQDGMPITALRSCQAVQEAPRDQDNDGNTVSDSTALGGPPIYTATDGISNDILVHPKSDGVSRDILTRRHAKFPQIEQLMEFLQLWEDDRWRREVAFAFDVTSSFAVDDLRRRRFYDAPSTLNLWDWNGNYIRQTIIGDEDFLLYVVDGVYKVWSFGDEIPMPKLRRTKWAPWRKTM